MTNGQAGHCNAARVDLCGAAGDTVPQVSSGAQIGLGKVGCAQNKIFQMSFLQLSVGI